MQKAVDSITNLNPEYEHRICDDQDCEDYIRTHFPSQVMEAYQTLIPKAFKADLWRYCVLYREGGVYMDIDFVELVPLRNILLEDDVFVSVKDRPRYVGECAVYQAFIACVPELPAMKNVIDFCVNNILQRERPGSCLAVTGPLAFGRAINEYRQKPDAPLWLGTNKVKETTLRLLLFEDDGSAVRDKENGTALFLPKFPDYYQEGAEHYYDKEFYLPDPNETIPLQACLQDHKLIKDNTKRLPRNDAIIWGTFAGCLCVCLLFIFISHVLRKHHGVSFSTTSQAEHSTRHPDREG
jgi:hypothetical protein